MEFKTIKEVENFFFDKDKREFINTDVREFVFRTHKYSLAAHDNEMKCELIFTEDDTREPYTIRIALEDDEVEIEFYDFYGRDCDGSIDYR